MDKYTVFNMIKNYNKSVEDPKDSDNGYEWLPYIISIYLATYAISNICAIVLLANNYSRLHKNMFIFLLCLLILFSNYIVVTPIIVIILVFIFRNKAISSFRF
jgi:hypothetical protein